MIEIRKVENDRRFMGKLLDYYLAKCIRFFIDVDDALRIQQDVEDFLETTGRSKDPFPGFEDLLTDDGFLRSKHGERILVRFVKNVEALQLDRLEFWKDGRCLDYNFRFTDIWEDDRLPHYFIIYNEPHQSYYLLDKHNANLLPWRLHVICPSDDKNIIIGEHFDEPFDSLGICAIRLRDQVPETDQTNPRISADAVPFETLMPGMSPDELPFVFPFGTNLPHLYIPLRSIQDILFRHRMQELMNADHLEETDENPDDDELHKYKDVKSGEDDGLPF